MPGLINRQSSASPPASSSSSPSPSSTGAQSQHTNTLVLAQLPAALFDPRVLVLLRDHFETYGVIHTWAPLRAFARIMVVYYSPDAAELAKAECDEVSIEQTSSTPQFVLRVYRADNTSLIEEDPNQHLRPPAIEKNFLISPPGSPPVGWEPIKEEPPNSAPLADDLIAALRKLQLSASGARVEVLLEPEDGAGIGVYVEDCDVGSDEENGPEHDWAYGEDNPARAQWRPVPTALPPVPVHC